MDYTHKIKEIKALIVMSDYTSEDVANHLGITPSSFSRSLTNCSIKYVDVLKILDFLQKDFKIQ